MSEADCRSVPAEQSLAFEFKSLTEIQDMNVTKWGSLKRTGTSIRLLQRLIRKHSRGNDQHWVQGYMKDWPHRWVQPCTRASCTQTRWSQRGQFVHKLPPNLISTLDWGSFYCAFGLECPLAGFWGGREETDWARAGRVATPFIQWREITPFEKRKWKLETWSFCLQSFF